MTQPFFSIITICRNEERDIRLTADSVVNQTCKNYEWLVLDGGSTDDTLKILQKYKKNMGYFMSEKDNGVYDAMNKGIKKATGKYIIFMNGGDLLHDKNVLQKVYDSITRDKTRHAIYFGNCMLHVNNIKKAKPIFIGTPLINGIKYRFLPHQSCVWQKSLFEKYGLHDTTYKFSGDYEFMLRTRHESILYMDYPIAYYNMADYHRRYLDRQNKENAKLFEPTIGKLHTKEILAAQRRHYGLFRYLYYYSKSLLIDIYYLMPFLQKPWRAFKKRIGIN